MPEPELVLDLSALVGRWNRHADRKRTSMTNWCGYARSLEPRDNKEDPAK